MNEIITDAKGRRIEVKEVVGSAMSRLSRAAGAAFGDNIWTGATMARVTVRSINDKPMPPLPATLEQIDSLWDMVDADAASAASKWLTERQDALLADAGNSSGHPDSATASG